MIIPITDKGKISFTEIDDEDAYLVVFRTWHTKESGYVVAGYKSKGCLYLHKLVMGVDGNKTVQVDHKDRNKLNNKKENLRICINAQNCLNKKFKLSDTGYQGVVWDNKNKKYTSQIQYRGKRYHLGMYDDPEIAAKVRDKKAIELHGEFANLNFPNENYSDDKFLPVKRQRKSLYRGVSKASKNRWASTIAYDKKDYHLGLFKTEQEAAKAYDDFVILHKIDRPINFPTNGVFSDR